MTIADVRARVEYIRHLRKASITRIMAENRLFTDVLRFVAQLAVVRAGARTFAEEALKVHDDDADR